MKGKGWEKLDRDTGKPIAEFGVSNLPGRKSVCVWSTEFHPEGGATVGVHAYCRNEEEAERLIAALDKFIKTEER